MNRRKIRVGLKNILPVMLAGLVLVSFGWGVYYLRQAGARSAQGFDPGNIMSDTVMSDYRTMTVEQIQAFLNSKVPHCDTYGQGLSPWWAPDYNKSGKTERWEWGQYREGVKTFTCLKDYKDSAGRSAAQLIYDKAHKYKINPQVLIVLLQKEQNLVLDTWPMQVQYKTATGYGCPDTAPCDSQYYGLENQLDWSAKMFRAILNRSSGWYTPYRLGINNIRWNPNPACGTSQVNVRNLATVALYSYTPYRPNQAALNAGYGSGDGCSAYGNRNFYLYFTDWFGDTNGSIKIIDKLNVATTDQAQQYFTDNKHRVTFKISNNSSKDYNYEYLGVGVRGPKGEIMDLPGATNLKLKSGQVFNYSYDFKTNIPGKLSFFILKKERGGDWTSCFDDVSSESCFTQKKIQLKPEIDEMYVQYTNSNQSVLKTVFSNKNIIVSMRVKNISEDPLHVKDLTIKINGSPYKLKDQIIEAGKIGILSYEFRTSSEGLLKLEFQDSIYNKSLSLQVKPSVVMTQGLTLYDQSNKPTTNLIANKKYRVKFKITNYSDQAYNLGNHGVAVRKDNQVIDNVAWSKTTIAPNSEYTYDQEFVPHQTGNWLLFFLRASDDWTDWFSNKPETENAQINKSNILKVL